MTIQTKFEIGATVFTIFNNHFTKGIIKGIEYKEDKIYYKLNVRDYHMLDNATIPEDRCGGTVEELVEIQTNLMKSMGDPK